MKILNKNLLRYSFALLLVTSTFQVSLTTPANAAPSLGMECSVIGKIDKSTPFPIICSRTNFDTKWEKLLILSKNSKSALNIIEVIQKDLSSYNIQELEDGVEALKEMQSLAVPAQVRTIQIRDEISLNTKRFESINSEIDDPYKVLITNICLAKLQNSMVLESSGSLINCPKLIQVPSFSFADIKSNPELASDPNAIYFAGGFNFRASIEKDYLYELVTDDVPYKDAPFFLWKANAEKAGVVHYFRSTKWLSAVSTYKLLIDEQQNIISENASFEKKMNELSDFVEYVNDSNKSNELSNIQNSISQVSVLQQQINTSSKKLLKLKVTNANRASTQESLNQIQVLLARLKGVFLVAKDVVPTYDTSLVRDLL
jgi:hypothetical protein